MITREIVRLFHGRRAGKGKWRAVCPIHGGKHSGPLLISERPDGSTGFFCFGGCDAGAILGSVGLSLSDLYIGDRPMTPEIQTRLRNEEELTRLDTRHGAFILNQTLDSKNATYWCAAELSVVAEIRNLRDRLYPEEKREREKEMEVQRIIAEYGFDELWECLP